jgi:hypothetical protein
LGEGVRRLFVIASLSLPLAAFPSLASADPPIGTCPPPFELRTFAQITGAPPGLLESVDKNADERVCVKPHPEAGLIIIDNTVPTP